MYQKTLFNNNIKDLSRFQLIEALKMWKCHNVYDLSVLFSIRKLTVRSCKKVKDIGNLRNIKRLIISKEIHGIHLLKNLEELEIEVNNMSKFELERIDKTLNKLKKINKKVSIIFMHNSL